MCYLVSPTRFMRVYSMAWPSLASLLQLYIYILPISAAPVELCVSPLLYTLYANTLLSTCPISCAIGRSHPDLYRLVQPPRNEGDGGGVTRLGLPQAIFMYPFPPLLQRSNRVNPYPLKVEVSSGFMLVETNCVQESDVRYLSPIRASVFPHSKGVWNQITVQYSGSYSTAVADVSGELHLFSRRACTVGYPPPHGLFERQPCIFQVLFLG